MNRQPQLPAPPLPARPHDMSAAAAQAELLAIALNCERLWSEEEARREARRAARAGRPATRSAGA
jgi:hypothetical protein